MTHKQDSSTVERFITVQLKEKDVITALVVNLMNKLN